MKKSCISLFLSILVLLPVLADTVYFADGRVCKGCKVKIGNTGYIQSVTDKKGNNWLTEQDHLNHTSMKIVKHPYLDKTLLGVAVLGKSTCDYSQQRTQYMQQQTLIYNQQNQTRQPIQTNCYTDYTGVHCTTY